MAASVYLVATALVLYGAMAHCGTLNMPTRARYVFPVAPTVAVLAMLGLLALLRPAAALRIAALTGYSLLLLSPWSSPAPSSESVGRGAWTVRV